MDVLVRIKQLVLRGAMRFTEKARHEMRLDDLTRSDVAESIVSATRIDKVVRSTSLLRRKAGEKLYVIKSFNYAGTLIYTKGTIVHEPEGETFYISSKIATFDE